MCWPVGLAVATHGLSAFLFVLRAGALSLAVYLSEASRTTQARDTFFWCAMSWGMSRALLKLSGSLVHDYATISDDSPSPNRASRARRAATSAGIS